MSFLWKLSVSWSLVSRSHSNRRLCFYVTRTTFAVTKRHKCRLQTIVNVTLIVCSPVSEVSLQVHDLYSEIVTSEPLCRSCYVGRRD
jgi:hypothetical protein